MLLLLACTSQAENWVKTAQNQAGDVGLIDTDYQQMRGKNRFAKVKFIYNPNHPTADSSMAIVEFSCSDYSERIISGKNYLKNNIQDKIFFEDAFKPITKKKKNSIWDSFYQVVCR